MRDRTAACLGLAAAALAVGLGSTGNSLAGGLASALGGWLAAPAATAMPPVLPATPFAVERDRATPRHRPSGPGREREARDDRGRDPY